MPLHIYTVKEFAMNPSKLIHRAMSGEEDVVITLRGVPAVRLAPVAGSAKPPSARDLWAAMADVTVAKGPMTLPEATVSLAGEDSAGSEWVLEDRR